MNAQRPRRGSRRERLPLKATQRAVTLWSIVCSVCTELGPVVDDPSKAARPDSASGYVLRRVGNLVGWLCPDCGDKYTMMLPPPTRADCLDGPRPCRAILCKFNLHYDVSRKAKDDFELGETCALDVADRGQHTLRVVGGMLGMTREGSRTIEVSAMTKMRALPNIGIDFGDEDYE